MIPQTDNALTVPDSILATMRSDETPLDLNHSPEQSIDAIWLENAWTRCERGVEPLPIRDIKGAAGGEEFDGSDEFAPQNGDPDAHNIHARLAPRGDAAGSPTLSITSDVLNISTSAIEKRKRQSSDSSDEKAPGARPYWCKFCFMKFSKSQALGGHMNRHRAEKLREHVVLAQKVIWKQHCRDLMRSASLPVRFDLQTSCSVHSDLTQQCPYKSPSQWRSGDPVLDEARNASYGRPEMATGPDPILPGRQGYGSDLNSLLPYSDCRSRPMCTEQELLGMSYERHGRESPLFARATDAGRVSNPDGDAHQRMSYFHSTAADHASLSNARVEEVNSELLAFVIGQREIGSAVQQFGSSSMGESAGFQSSSSSSGPADVAKVPMQGTSMELMPSLAVQPENLTWLCGNQRPVAPTVSSLGNGHLSLALGFDAWAKEASLPNQSRITGLNQTCQCIGIGPTPLSNIAGETLATGRSRDVVIAGSNEVSLSHQSRIRELNLNSQAIGIGQPLLDNIAHETSGIGTLRTTMVAGTNEASLSNQFEIKGLNLNCEGIGIDRTLLGNIIGKNPRIGSLRDIVVAGTDEARLSNQSRMVRLSPNSYDIGTGQHPLCKIIGETSTINQPRDIMVPGLNLNTQGSRIGQRPLSNITSETSITSRLSEIVIPGTSPLTFGTDYIEIGGKYN